ncbi:uncharacterized protein K452DRAFT_235189 [Aplosporella prunicola CBS 121167]|uniref:BTB domain-containing protein n=1 Tax=Aplosporella prunicola CBS 121167 TaxID=1176127 RepID=A0A6A6B1Q4_9PEZI|nr:uncharacterized protein K452DRAFT_235189 [Aplosporella prunicola CBS 121167]KAF2137980.1 hypothetical protein K452DRAFT_235189 [Aplosporella prunicola CBS 121167]
MVSYPETVAGDRSLARRPASSISTSTRRHRLRSHTGGSSYQPLNEFPVFSQTGDVEIVITSSPRAGRLPATTAGAYAGANATPRREERYVLHRLILSQCSGFFEADTAQGWSRTQTDGSAHPSGGALARLPPTDDAGRRRRWRYELDWGENGDELPMLVQKEASPAPFGGDRAPLPPPIHNKPTAPSAGFFRTMTNFSALHITHTSGVATHGPDDDIFRDYANLFRIFYNYPPALDSVNIAQAYVECKTLLQLADMYDALEVIGPRVDHHLLRFQGRLFKQIAKYPQSYLKLGYLARSRVIYKEALIHVVGQWPVGANQLRGQIGEGVMEVIEDKADELEDLKTKIENKLYKLTLTTTRGERITPSNGFLDWMAMCLFRQWLTENTSRPTTSILKDTSARHRSMVGAPSSNRSATGSASGGQDPPPPPPNTGRIFRLIGQGGGAYLGHDELKRFLKLNAEFYTRDNMRRFERRVEELKNLAQAAVAPLMRNFLELDLTRDGVGGGGAVLPYLTCTRVDEADFAWDE